MLKVHSQSGPISPLPPWQIPYSSLSCLLQHEVGNIYIYIYMHSSVIFFSQAWHPCPFPATWFKPLHPFLFFVFFSLVCVHEWVCMHDSTCACLFLCLESVAWSRAQILFFSFSFLLENKVGLVLCSLMSSGKKWLSQQQDWLTCHFLSLIYWVDRNSCASPIMLNTPDWLIIFTSLVSPLPHDWTTWMPTGGSGLHLRQCTKLLWFPSYSGAAGRQRSTSTHWASPPLWQIHYFHSMYHYY